TSGEKKNASMNQLTGSRPFSQATHAATNDPPIQTATAHSMNARPSRTSSTVSSLMARLVADAQQEKDQDQAQRKTEKPEQYEDHLTNLQCRRGLAASGSG